MPKIDPSEYATQNFDRPQSNVKLTEGRKVMTPVAAAYKMVREKKVLEMCMVCTEDLEKTTEEGAIHFETFYLSERALWRISNWAMGMGWSTSFDPEEIEDIRKIMLHGQFTGVFKTSEYTNYNGDLVSKIELKWFNQSSRPRNKDGAIEFSTEEVEFLTGAEKRYTSIIEYKKSNYGDKYLTEEKPKADEEDYDEIPF